MKSRRFIVLALLSAVVTIVCAQKNMKFEPIGGGKAKLVDAHKTEGEVVVPEKVTISGGVYTVTVIGKEAFYNKKRKYGDHVHSLKKVTLPPTITKLEDQAFFLCNDLEEINFPPSLKEIGYWVFACCYELKSIDLPSVKKIGRLAFENCNALTNVQLSDSLEYIGEKAFAHCAFKHIVIPNSVKKIGGAAFESCPLEAIVVPDNAEKFGNYSIFSNCKQLKSVRGHQKVLPWWVESQIYDELPFKQKISEVKSSFSYYATGILKNRMDKWQQKGEFETNAEWKARLTQKNFNSQAKEYANQLVQEYARKNAPSVLSLSVGKYDADSETFEILSTSCPPFFVQVPISDMESFRSNFHSGETKTTYGVVNDRVGIVAAVCTVNGKQYHSVENRQATQALDEMAQNLTPITLDLGSESAATQTVKDSDVDLYIPVAKTVNDHTFAFVIGNENYQLVSKVPYAHRDSKAFAAYCQKTLGVPEKNVRLYQDATFGILLSVVQDAQNIVKAFNGDVTLIFYYAGHGIPSDSDREPYLLPVDANGRQTEGCYAVGRLYKELGELGARSVVMFLDACFSGAQRNEGMLVASRGVAIKAKASEPRGNMVVFSAAEGDQTAFPFEDKSHGMFTYYLLKLLQESKGEVTLGELGDYLTKEVMQQSILINNKMQRPTVQPSADLKDTWKSIKLK